MPQAWEEHFGKWLGPVPEVLQSPAHAEFAISAGALRSRPRAFYESTRHWLATTSLDSYRAGLVLEYLWALIATGEPAYWAPQEQCLCVLYGLCLPQQHLAAGSYLSQGRAPSAERPTVGGA
jgi:hypothetical protein